MATFQLYKSTRFSLLTYHLIINFQCSSLHLLPKDFFSQESGWIIKSILKIIVFQVSLLKVLIFLFSLLVIKHVTWNCVHVRDARTLNNGKQELYPNIFSFTNLRDTIISGRVMKKNCFDVGESSGANNINDEDGMCEGQNVHGYGNYG